MLLDVKRVLMRAAADSVRTKGSFFVLWLRRVGFSAAELLNSAAELLKERERGKGGRPQLALPTELAPPTELAGSGVSGVRSNLGLTSRLIRFIMVRGGGRSATTGATDADCGDFGRVEDGRRKTKSVTAAHLQIWQ